MALDLRISFTDNDEAVARMTECWRTAEGVQVEKKDLGELYQLHDGQWTPWNANKTEVEALIPVALIEIKEWYLDYGLSKFSEASSQHQATFLFGLAHTLGHELAHVAWFHAREQQRREVKTKAEPFHDIADPEAEWGWSWESRILPRYKDQPIIVNWADVGFHDAAMVWAPWVTPVGDGSAWEDKSGEENNICGFGLRPFFSKAVWDRVVASPDGLAEVRKLFDPCHIGHNKSACHSGEHIDHDGDSVMI
ncbi:hypothetical protein EJ08DRAFT_77808 [Tothia fuscella]|uniref:Uncharacterized protein n=1 Tax=Tothia fuscella TaxID=1048955 RepID=A0A9P4NX91_9PEZI|nr:hypothetical protein EJ08DRAFT_77808 [Tothia fuscella]